MPNKCCIDNCKSRSQGTNPTISSYRFPNDEIERQRWVRALPKRIKVMSDSQWCSRFLTIFFSCFVARFIFLPLRIARARVWRTWTRHSWFFLYGYLVAKVTDYGSLFLYLYCMAELFKCWVVSEMRRYSILYDCTCLIDGYIVIYDAGLYIHFCGCFFHLTFFSFSTFLFSLSNCSWRRSTVIKYCFIH